MKMADPQTWVKIAIVVIVIIVIIGAILVPVLMSTANSPPPPPTITAKAPSPPLFTSNSNPGISTTGTFGGSSNGSFYRDSLSCTSASGSDRRYWSTSTSSCQCKVPYWGDKCQYESYSSNYFAVGSPQPGDVTGSISRTVEAPNLSFNTQLSPIGSVTSTTVFVPTTTPMDTKTHEVKAVSPVPSASTQDTCTSLCDRESTCVGVYWDSSRHKCSLLSSIPSIQENKSIPFHPYTDSTLFLKGQGSRPYTPNSVFLINGNVPLRYWLYDRLHLSPAQEGGPTNLLQVQKGKQYVLGFKPATVINSGNLTGVYSDKPLPPMTTGSLLSSANVYIHSPGTILDTSHSVHSSPQVWVTYV